MKSLVRFGWSFLACLLLVAPAAAVSPIASFEVRLAQTNWNLQAVEGLVRSFDVGPDSRPTPDALAAYLDLLSENVAALSSLALNNLTSEQKRVVAVGLRSVAGRLKDQTLMAGIRGLSGPAAAFSQLEASCLAAVRLL